MKKAFTTWAVTILIFFIFLITHANNPTWTNTQLIIFLADIVIGIAAFILFILHAFARYKNKIDWGIIGMLGFWISVIALSSWYGKDQQSEPQAYEQNIQNDNEDYRSDLYDRPDDFSSERPYETTGDLDCSDFSSQAEAQDFFESEGGPDSDYHNLDRDSDGYACETL